MILYEYSRRGVDIGGPEPNDADEALTERAWQFCRPHSMRVTGTPGVMKRWCQEPSWVRDMATPMDCPSTSFRSTSRVAPNRVWLTS